MNDTLFVVESPTKAKSIKKYFPDFNVMATVGHFRDLPVKELGVDTETHRPTYVTSEGKADIVSRLVKAGKTAKVIYLATDPDREGEAIAAHAAFVLGKDAGSKVFRVTYQEVTKGAIENAIRQKRAIDWKLVKAQEGRRILDRYVGYLVSPELTKKFRQHHSIQYLSAGRVQSVALRLIVERAETIENFVPVEHYGVRAHLSHGGQTFAADWILLDEKGKPKSQEITDKALAASVSQRTRQLKLAQQENKLVSVAPPAPLTTSSYVKLMSSLFKLTTRQCMDVAQKLFEQGLITYHRTDSPYMGDDFAQKIRLYAHQRGLPLPQTAKQHKAKAGAQEAHECLRVTDIQREQASTGDALQDKVYHAIWEITLCSQLSEGKDERTTFFWRSDANDFFISRGRVLITPGFRQVYGELPDDEERAEASQPLPKVDTGSVLKPTRVELQTKHTKPPAVFTEKSLIGAMEAMAIGRPATYASVIETIVNRNYVLRDPKKLTFTPQPIGRAIVAAGRGQFSFLDYDYTAEAEKQFDDIAQGKRTYDQVIRDAYQRLSTEIAAFKDRQLNDRVITLIKALPAELPVKSKSSAAKTKTQNNKSSSKKTTAPKKR